MIIDIKTNSKKLYLKINYILTAKNYTANNLTITREAGLTPRESSISYDVYGLMYLKL